MFVNNQDGIKRQGQDFDKKFVFERVHSKEVDNKFPEKRWTKRGVNKLLKKSRDTGAVKRQPVSSRPRKARTEENVETVYLVLSQEDKLQTHRTVRKISREMGIHRSSECQIIGKGLVSEVFQEAPCTGADRRELRCSHEAC